MNPSVAQIPDKMLEIKKIRQSIVQAILDLPDNPNIQRISEHPRCFTMSSKEVFGGHNSTADMRISGNLSFFFHDFKSQYELISEVVNDSHIENVIGTLQAIVETGKYRKNDFTYKFHPSVVAHLRTFLT